MKVINLYGGPGCGKSTMAAAVFTCMKLKGYNVELVTEYAKDLVWDNRLEDMLDQQEYIFAKQNHRLHRLRDHVDYVVTDSPLMLSIVYPNALTWPAYHEFCDFVRATNLTYDNMNFFLNRFGADKFQEVGRAHNYDQSVDLDHQIRYMLTNDIRTPYTDISAQSETIEDLMETADEIMRLTVNTSS